MFKVRMLKLKTEAETYFAKLCGVFNKPIKGIKIKYNRNYCGDKHKYHDVDIIYSANVNANSRVMDEHAVDINYDNKKDAMAHNAETHDLNLAYADNAAAKPCVVYMHGGGWCAYDKRVFRSTCKRLCDCGTVVFNCNFRLAPKFSVEDMQQDVYTIIDYVSANARRYGGDPEKIILAGDSAGAHLLSLFINKALLRGEAVAEKVKGCAFFYGVYDLETALDTGFTHLNTYMSAIVPPSTADYHARLREISPVSYVSDKIPPTLICSGQIDKLNDSQSQQYARILRKNGVRAETLIFPKEFTAAKHKFITFDTNAAAKRSFAAFGEFIKTL